MNPSMHVSLAKLNAMDQRKFEAILGDVVEHSPWVVRGAWSRRPFHGLADLAPVVVGEASEQGTRTTATRVMFHPASGIACEVVAQAQASLRRRILRAFVSRGLLEGFEAQEMLAYKHSGFSVDTSVCIAAHDRAGLGRLLRYCARPPFALDRLRKAGRELIYRCAKQHSEPGSDRRDQRDHRNAKRGAKHWAQANELHFPPLELIDRLAALVPPPRVHRHRYYGVLAPHSPLRAASVALAAGQTAGTGTGTGTAQPEPGGVPAAVDAMGVATVGGPSQPEPAQPVPPKGSAHILWAALIARIYEVFPLLCPICSGQMRIIAFIRHSADIRQILEHIGAETEPPRIAPARGPPLWAEADAGVGAGVQAEGAQAMEPLPDWGEGCQAAPDFEVDQRVSW